MTMGDLHRIIRRESEAMTYYEEVLVFGAD
jgi:hypothetical protein